MWGSACWAPPRSGRTVSLSPRDRAVLSALCVQPGQAVPAEVLADAVWGEAPPKSWGKVVQGSVMRLRRAVGSSAIETTAGGYRIVLPEGQLDTVEFEHLVARGRSFLAVNEPQRAATMFEQALALWRGPPFPELADWDRARSEGARLLDVRRAVEEDLVEAHLAAGRAVEAAAEARPLVAREPFRERRWALLATALYRTGRQGEALDVLRRASRTMRDELGLDPGAELVELEARILAQDPSLLDVPNRIGGSSATCPYRGLRPFDAQDADFYFGRDAVVAEAVRRLEEFPLLLVVGPSGSGKSSLVRAGIVPTMGRVRAPGERGHPGHGPAGGADHRDRRAVPGRAAGRRPARGGVRPRHRPGGHPGVPRPSGRPGRGRHPGGRHPARGLPRLAGREPAAVPPGRTRADAADPVDRGRAEGGDRGTSPAGGPDPRTRAGRRAGPRRGRGPRRAAAALPRPGRDLGTPRVAA